MNQLSIMEQFLAIVCEQKEWNCVFIFIFIRIEFISFFQYSIDVQESVRAFLLACVDNDAQWDVLYRDFSIAFHSVDHQILIKNENAMARVKGSWTGLRSSWAVSGFCLTVLDFSLLLLTVACPQGSFLVPFYWSFSSKLLETIPMLQSQLPTWMTLNCVEKNYLWADA